MKTLEHLRTYCLQKPGAYEHFPFDDVTLTFRVAGKMFALCNVNHNPLEVNLKCDPELSELLREKYDAIKAGWHMNKKHWNTLTLNGSIPDHEVLELIDMSYERVVKKLSRLEREQLTKPTFSRYPLV
jgi:predicted DNA-binding protein (MmcQ/YjbR family)